MVPTYERERFRSSGNRYGYSGRSDGAYPQRDNGSYGGDYTFRSHGGTSGPNLREWIDRDNRQNGLGLHQHHHRR